MDDAPKSALELALARLKRKDDAEGTVERFLTDEQKVEMADIRKIYAARLAQTEILHQSGLASTFDPQERSKREDEYRRDVQRLHDERDRKVELIRTRA